MRIIARWGVALGVALAAWTLFVHVMGWYTTNLAAGRIADRVVIVLPIAAIALALRNRARGGVRPLGFVTALGVGAGVGLISAIVFTPFLWWYHHFMNPAWLDHVIAFERGRLAGVGTAAADIERAIETTRRGATDVAQITGGFVGSLILCVVVAALLWALMRGAGALRARSASG
jgi:hypothetical protein